MLENAPLLLFLCLVGLLAVVAAVAIGAIFGTLAGGLTKHAFRRRPNADALAKIAKRLTHFGFATFIAYTGYTAVYPTDDFYLAEFWLATDQVTPTDAVVVAKDSTYPDFHGDYCSFSRIKLSNTAYQSLLLSLQGDARFLGEPSSHVATGQMGALNLKPLRAAHSFRRTDIKSDHHRSVVLFEDGIHVEVQVCVT